MERIPKELIDLKKKIERNYGSVSVFSELTNIPYQTINSYLKNRVRKKPGWLYLADFQVMPEKISGSKIKDIIVKRYGSVDSFISKHGDDYNERFLYRCFTDSKHSNKTKNMRLYELLLLIEYPGTRELVMPHEKV